MHWLAHIEGGPRRVNHAATAVGKFIYSFGGYCSNDRMPDYIDIHVLDTDTLRWSPLHYVEENYEDIPFQRFGHTVVTFEGKIYLHGGRNDIQSFSILHCFDPGTKRWSVPKATGNIPFAVDGHTACVIGHYMYLLGGYEEDTANFKGNLHRINLKTFVWEEVRVSGFFPDGRDFHTATAVGDRMYVFGGRNYDFGMDSFDGGNYSDIIYYLDTSRMSWEWPIVTGTHPCGRRSHSSFSFGHEIFILCGYNSLLDKHFNDMFRFNTKTNTWSEVICQGVGPSHRRRQCCVRVDEAVFVFGGTSPAYLSSSGLDNSCDDVPLKDLSDLYVLDIFPTLYRSCLLKIVSMHIDLNRLPSYINSDIQLMTAQNNITAVKNASLVQTTRAFLP